MDNQNHTASPMGIQVLRLLQLTQAWLCGPSALVMTVVCLADLFDPYGFGNMAPYTFVRYLVNAHLATAIVIIVIIQRRNSRSAMLNVKYEAAKSILATLIWFLLLLDAVFVRREDQTIKANASIIVVLLLFYPTLLYTMGMDKRQLVREQDQEQGQDQEANSETTPLLSA